MSIIVIVSGVTRGHLIELMSCEIEINEPQATLTVYEGERMKDFQSHRNRMCTFSTYIKLPVILSVMV